MQQRVADGEVGGEVERIHRLRGVVQQVVLSLALLVIVLTSFSGGVTRAVPGAVALPLVAGALLALRAGRISTTVVERSGLVLATVAIAGYHGASLVGEVTAAGETARLDAAFREFRTIVLLTVIGFYSLAPRRALAYVGALVIVWTTARTVTIGHVDPSVLVTQTRITTAVYLAIVCGLLYALAASSTWLRSGNATLTDTLAVRREMQGMAAHDLRGPLSAARAGVETVLERGDVLDAAQQRLLLRRAVAALDRAVGLGDDLLRETVDAVPDGQWSDVDADELLRQAVRESRAADDEVLVTSTVPSVRVPRQTLQRIVVNLVDNAVRHGRPPVQVQLDAEPGWTVLTVRDAGEGVPEATDVFAAFRSGAVERADAFGLGLFIVHRLVTTVGGSVSATGSTFVVRVPTR